MLEGIPVSLDVLAPSALIGLVVLMIFTGRLVTKAQVDRLVAEYQKQLDDMSHDRDEWRAAHRISETGRQEERDHAVALTDALRKPIRTAVRGFRKASGAEVSE